MNRRLIPESDDPNWVRSFLGLCDELGDRWVLPVESFPKESPQGVSKSIFYPKKLKFSAHSLYTFFTLQIMINWNLFISKLLILEPIYSFYLDFILSFLNGVWAQIWDGVLEFRSDRITIFISTSATAHCSLRAWDYRYAGTSFIITWYPKVTCG